jgi:hypothetical protein
MAPEACRIGHSKVVTSSSTTSEARMLSTLARCSGGTSCRRSRPTPVAVSDPASRVGDGDSVGALLDQGGEAGLRLLEAGLLLSFCGHVYDVEEDSFGSVVEPDGSDIDAALLAVRGEEDPLGASGVRGAVGNRGGDRPGYVPLGGVDVVQEQLA